MASWTLAPSLKGLFVEVNTRWPNRDKDSDGSIGDAAHSARTSQHNPNRDPSDSIPDGTVTAIDIDSTNINANLVISKLIQDPRVWYVIHNRTIWSRTFGFRARAYNGSNPHTGHIHVSLMQNGTAVKSTAKWDIAATAPAPKPVETDTDDKKLIRLSKDVKPGRRHRQVPTLQRLLIKAGYGPIRGSITTFYGRETQKAVVRFHKANPQFADGPNDTVIGPKGFNHLQKEANDAS